MKNIWMVILGLAAFACQENNDFITESGVEVACVVKGDGEVFAKDSVLLLRLKVTTADDQILIESGKDPMPLLYDPERPAGDIQEVLTNMEVGDSVVFETSVENLYSETYQTPIPDTLNAADKVKVMMKATDMMSRQAFQAYSMEQQQKAMASQLTEDVEAIDAYLAEQGIDAQTTESGLRYVITDEGNGTFAQSGDSIYVNYAGKILEGAYFDTSIEEVAREQGIYNEQRAIQIGYNPFGFTVGRGQVIKGWDEGLLLIPEGGKGTLYIPSPLGYGARGSGPVIGPYSILEFDVEVIKVSPQGTSVD
ncbi:FKBP-type peptidyl-prolyl cis-trans isomerase [Marinoscillum sp.]|uniref:FKBP-type peptidyl-prolyl cis-trans isomerase n=1 Tax=Marinoscillum sp. TaxID=2024838 RepID=UPI003BACAE01